jgi:hypothetical protein
MQEIDIHDYARQLFDARGALSRPLKRLAPWKSKANAKRLKFGGTSRRRSSRCADRTKAEGAPRRRQRLLADAYLGGR